jgi:hypothetical protein
MRTSAYYLRACEPTSGEPLMWASILLVAMIFFFILASSFAPPDAIAWR